jgi:dTDP-glucose pyrophosphorylase
MGGKGYRFFKDGFSMPKPLIMLNNKPFFYWAVQSVSHFVELCDISFVVLQEHIDEFNIDVVIRQYYPDANIVVIPEVLPGAVLTCMEGVKVLNDNQPILFNDCDHMLRCDMLTELVKNPTQPFNSLVTFKSNDPCYSYVRYQDGKFVGTVEKKVVSEDAICGAYMYKSAQTFLDAANKLLARGTGDYAEFFLSDTYNILHEQGEDVQVMSLDVHTSFGTPSEYREIIKPEHDKEFIL